MFLNRAELCSMSILMTKPISRRLSHSPNTTFFTIIFLSLNTLAKRSWDVSECEQRNRQIVRIHVNNECNGMCMCSYWHGKLRLILFAPISLTHKARTKTLSKSIISFLPIDVNDKSEFDNVYDDRPLALKLFVTVHCRVHWIWMPQTVTYNKIDESTLKLDAYEKQ